MTFEDVDEDCFAFAPMQVIPELYVDLDIQLLTAPDDQARWSALTVGTREVLDRFDHIVEPKIICATGEFVINQLAQCVRGFRDCGFPSFADWLQDVVDVLTAHQLLQTRCAETIRRAENDADAITAILEAAHALDAAAEQVAMHQFGSFPTYRAAPPNYQLMGYAGTCLSIETRRNPLRLQLDGAGGAAGSPEFNPYVAGLYDLERAVHRRLYRLFYRLAEHVGIDLGDDPHRLFETPDDVDRQDF